MLLCNCISKLAPSWPQSASPDSPDHGLKVGPQTSSIMASKCISKLAQSWPPTASLSPLNLGLQLHLQTHSIMASQCISEFTPLSSSGAPAAFPKKMFLSVCSTVIQCASRWSHMHLKATTSVQDTKTRYLGDGKCVILRQRVRESVRAVRSVHNTWLILTETIVVADDVSSLVIKSRI